MVSFDDEFTSISVASTMHAYEIMNRPSPVQNTSGLAVIQSDERRSQGQPTLMYINSIDPSVNSSLVLFILFSSWELKG